MKNTELPGQRPQHMWGWEPKSGVREKKRHLGSGRVPIEEIPEILVRGAEILSAGKQKRDLGSGRVPIGVFPGGRSEGD